MSLSTEDLTDNSGNSSSTLALCQCGQPGHISSLCPSGGAAAGGAPSAGACYKCGQPGREFELRQCDGRFFIGRLCLIFRATLDMARDCSQGGVSSYGGAGRAGGNCYNCG